MIMADQHHPGDNPLAYFGFEVPPNYFRQRILSFLQNRLCRKPNPQPWLPVDGRGDWEWFVTKAGGAAMSGQTRGIRPDLPGNSALTDRDRVNHALSVRFSELVGELRKLNWPASRIATLIKSAGFGGGENSQEALGKLEEWVEEAKAGKIPSGEVPKSAPPKSLVKSHDND